MLTLHGVTQLHVGVLNINWPMVLNGIVLRLELALVFPEEEGMMQQSSVSISLSF